MLQLLGSTVPEAKAGQSKKGGEVKNEFQKVISKSKKVAKAAAKLREGKAKAAAADAEAALASAYGRLQDKKVWVVDPTAPIL